MSSLRFVVAMACIVGACAASDVTFAATCGRDCGPMELQQRLSAFFNVDASRVTVSANCSATPCDFQWTVTDAPDDIGFTVTEVVYLATHEYAPAPLMQIGVANVALYAPKSVNTNGVYANLTAHPTPMFPLNLTSAASGAVFSLAYSTEVSDVWVTSFLQQSLRIDTNVVAAAITNMPPPAGSSSSSSGGSSAASGGGNIFDVSFSCASPSLMAPHVCDAALTATLYTLAAVDNATSTFGAQSWSLSGANTTALETVSGPLRAKLSGSWDHYQTLVALAFGASNSVVPIRSSNASGNYGDVFVNLPPASTTCWNAFASAPIFVPPPTPPTALQRFPLVGVSAGISAVCCLLVVFIINRRVARTDFTLPGQKENQQEQSEPLTAGKAV